MRLVFMSLIVIALGASIGLGMTWMEFHDVQEYFQPVSLTTPAVSTATNVDTKDLTGPVAVVVGGSKFDFGVLNHDQAREKGFVIRNEGTEPLNLSWGGESCGKCISNIRHLDSVTVPPGGSYEVFVGYATRKAEPQFSESAYINTSDLRNSRLQLQIVGAVTMAVKVDPATLALTSISTSEPSSVSAKLFGYHSDKLELVKYEFSDPTSGAFIEITAKPLSEEAIKVENHARAGLDLLLDFKPGLPIGPLSQNVTLTALTDSEHTIVLPITGSVVGDMSIYGKNFDANTGNLNLGILNRNVGVTAEVFVLVKGPQRNDVKLTVGSVDPPETLQVTIGEPAALAGGKTIKIPVKVVVPKGAAKTNRLGTQQGKSGKIILESTHPVSKQLPISVRFAVE
jgi:hypothetical protein